MFPQCEVCCASQRGARGQLSGVGSSFLVLVLGRTELQIRQPGWNWELFVLRTKDEREGSSSWDNDKWQFTLLTELTEQPADTQLPVHWQTSPLSQLLCVPAWTEFHSTSSAVAALQAAVAFSLPPLPKLNQWFFLILIISGGSLQDVLAQSPALKTPLCSRLSEHRSFFFSFLSSCESRRFVILFFPMVSFVWLSSYPRAQPTQERTDHSLSTSWPGPALSQWTDNPGG